MPTEGTGHGWMPGARLEETMCEVGSGVGEG